MTTIFNVLLFSLAILPFGVRGISEGRIALRRLRVNIWYLVSMLACRNYLSCDDSCNYIHITELS